jgi:hypothetical protein
MSYSSPRFRAVTKSIEETNLSQKTKDWEALQQALLMHYNQICMQYYDSQTEGAVTEMQKWCHALSYYLTLTPSRTPTARESIQEWRGLKQCANTLQLKLHRLANPVYWKANEWVALVSELGEAYADYLTKEERFLNTLENITQC